jgi:hypothetical protein
MAAITDEETSAFFVYSRDGYYNRPFSGFFFLNLRNFDV